jgi:hypothetical protein
MDKHTREISFDSPEIVALIEERGAISAEGLKCAEEMQRLSEEHKAIMEKNDELLIKLNEKKLQIIEKTKEKVDGQLMEYEVPVTTKIVDGRVHLVVADLLEEYKENFVDFDPWKQAMPTKSKE